MPDEEVVPDIYTDFVNIVASDWGVVLGFRTTSIQWDDLVAGPGASGGEGAMSVPTVLKAVVRLTPAHAKAMTIQLKKVLLLYEKRFGEIVLPPSVTERIDFQPGEWD